MLDSLILPLVLSALAASAQVQSSSLVVQAAEVFLLHRGLAPSALQGLRIWDNLAADWRVPNPGEIPARPPVTVVHLWAHYCLPCIAELPQVARWASRLNQESRGAVRVMIVAESTDRAAMQAKWAVLGRTMPSTLALYQDPTGALFDDLAKTLPATRTPGLPLTLVLDDTLTVRQAVVGSLPSRMNELTDGIRRLAVRGK